MLRIQSLVPLKSLSIVSIATMLAASSAQAGSLATPIVGGKAVAPGDWPDVVAIELRDGGVCTGTLLAADLVLTAAHCIEANPTKVIVGSVDIDQPDGERRAVKWSRAYPSWLDAYDVGIVMLDHPVQAKQRAIAKDCTETDHLASGTPLTVVGFGLTRQSGEGYNTRLHEATVPVHDATCERDPSCVTAIAPGGELTAGGAGIDSCFGDSGGPLFVETPSGQALIGIVSRGLLSTPHPCGDGGVYVRADKVVEWIERVSGRDVDRVSCIEPPEPPADAAGDDAADSGGCTAGGGVLESGLALWFGALYILTFRRARRGATRVTTRRPWPRSR